MASSVPWPGLDISGGGQGGVGDDVAVGEAVDDDVGSSSSCSFEGWDLRFADMTVWSCNNFGTRSVQFCISLHLNSNEEKDVLGIGDRKQRGRGERWQLCVNE